MVTAEEARKICYKSGKLSFDKKYLGVVKYVEDEIKNSAMSGYGRVVLEFSKILFINPDMKITDLADFLRSKGYLIKTINDSREDDGLLIISW